MSAFVPPRDKLMAAITGDLDDATVRIDTGVLKVLLQTMLRAYRFDTKAYRSEPGVSSDLAGPAFDDAADHFASKGYFDGLDPAPLFFDESWYCRTYPEVRLAIEQGEFPDALTHYLERGRDEWRSPNAEAQDQVMTWMLALTRPAVRR